MCEPPYLIYGPSIQATTLATPSLATPNLTALVLTCEAGSRNYKNIQTT